MMIAAMQRERKKGKNDRLTRLTASRLAGQLSTERQVLKHCNLDSLLAIVKTLAQSVEGLTGLKSLSVEPPRPRPPPPSPPPPPQAQTHYSHHSPACAKSTKYSACLLSIEIN